MITVIEIIAVVLVLGAALIRPGGNWRWLKGGGRAFSRLARRRWLAVLAAGVFGFAVSAALCLVRVPEPSVHDEFSSLLAAETFAHGRLTNPTHPMWVHFESIHIIQRPSYQSKYPPGQGLVLALGILLAGHPIVGVWLSVGAACAAVCWMLQAFVPSRWALLGAMLLPLRLGVLGQWGTAFPMYWIWSYWGGMLAVGGGALVFGALRRIAERPRVRHGLLMAVGLGIFANTRPFEGLIASLPAAAVILIWIAKSTGAKRRALLAKVCVPGFLALAAVASAMAYYNFRVTGSPLRLPYQVHQETYDVAPTFIWQKPLPEPSYNHEALRAFHTGWEMRSYKAQQTFTGWLKDNGKMLGVMWFFFLGPALTLPLLMLPWALRDRWMKFSALTCALVVAALLQESWKTPHYLAPITPLIFAVAVQCTRHLRATPWHGARPGRVVAAAIPLIIALSLAVSAGRYYVWMKTLPEPWSRQRVIIVRDLEKAGGKHLVIVRYRPNHIVHAEWVYNDADIDSAKVVWARDMGEGKNAELLRYFRDRQAWLLEADAQPPLVMPYEAAQSTTPEGGSGP